MEKQNKVYIITKGSYSDYHICAATLDKDTAEILMKKFSEDSWNNAVIEEYNLQGSPEEIRYMYSVRFEDGDVHCVFNEYETETEEKIVCHKTGRTGKDIIWVYVKATDEEHAKKIAQDRRAEYLAEKEGVV